MRRVEVQLPAMATVPLDATVVLVVAKARRKACEV